MATPLEGRTILVTGSGRGIGREVALLAGRLGANVVVNDPGSSTNIRRVYPRKDVIYAWAYSRNAVYLIYPEDHEIPQDRFGHWDSWTSHQRIILER